MRTKVVLIAVVLIAGYLMISCQNSMTGSDRTLFAGVYTYQQIDTSGSIVEEGTLNLSQNDSLLIGTLKTGSFASKIRGKIVRFDSVIFWEDSRKVASFVWYGSYKNGVVQGIIALDTGGPPVPLFVANFIAIRETF